MPPGPAFRMESFLDYLTFEKGLSERTLSAYARDLVRKTTAVIVSKINICFVHFIVLHLSLI